MNISNDLKKFISKHIDLIENKDIRLLKSLIQREDIEDKYDLYQILKELYGYYDYLCHTTTVEPGIFYREKLHMIKIPPTIDSFYSGGISKCDVGTVYIEQNPRQALKMFGSPFAESLIHTIVCNRDLEAIGNMFDGTEVKKFEVYGDIVYVRDYNDKPAFSRLYVKSPNTEFTVSKDSKITAGGDKYLLSQYLSACGFKNIKIV